MTLNQQRNLIKKAVAAMRRAYAPYSRFRVGAALLTSNGRIFTGCNVENASYGLTLCAERAAVATAVASGSRNFKAIAIVGGTRQPPYPCGACLQVLAEFCRPDCLIILAPAGRPSVFQTYRLKDLLPHAFELGRQGRQLVSCSRGGNAVAAERIHALTGAATKNNFLLD